MKHPHPTNFYAANRLYSGRAFPKGPVWGALTDGPEEREQLLTRICDDFPEADLETLVVWHHQDDVPCRIVTEDVLAEVAARLAPTEDELAEQAACDRADDYAHRMREDAA